jgi:predicted secreted protein
VEVVALIRRVCLFLVAKMSDRFLEQQRNIKFCVKLGKNASDTCAVFSKSYGGYALTKSSVFELYKWFKESH